MLKKFKTAVALIALLIQWQFGAQAQSHVTCSLQNCSTSSANTLEFDLYIVNDGTTSLKFNSVAFGIDINSGILVNTADNLQMSYVGSSDLPPVIVSSFSFGYASLELKFTSLPFVVNSATAPSLNANAPVKVGRFLVTNLSHNWVASSTTQFALDTTLALGRTLTCAVAYVGAATVGTNFDHTGNRNVSASCSITLNCASTIYYVDVDHDGYGSSSDPGTLYCSNPGTGFSSNNLDCNDANAQVHPGATDVCNGIDDDCNGVVDDHAITAASANNNGPLCAGTTLHLTSSSSGGTSYSWSGPNGFTSNSQNPNINNVTSAAGGTYTVTTTNSFSCSKQATTTVTVNPATAITHQPTSQTVCAGTTVAFSVTAQGAGLTYQWKKSTANISGATNSSYTIANVSSSNAGNYKVVVTGSCGSTTSSAATLTVNPSPNATASNNGPVCAGNTLNLLSGGGSSYSWSGPNGFTSSQQNPHINAVTTAASGAYTVTVSNSSGCSKKATTTATVNPATAITQQPASRTVCAGSSVTFTVTAVGGSLTYQWKKGNSMISGATGTSYTIANVSSSSAGSYKVVVNGACGPITSNPAVLTVNPAPLAFASSNSPVCSASTLNLSSGGGTSYSWAGPNGFTSSSQNPSITNVTSAASGTYTVTVFNSTGCSKTATTAVQINTNCGTCSGFKTWTQYEFGDCSSEAGAYMTSNFSLAFPSHLVLGCTKTLTLTTSSAICNFLPTEGPERKLIANVVNPTDAFHNSLASELTALALNIGFDNYDAAYMPSTIHLQDLYIASGPFTGWTVLQLYNQAISILGGCSTAYSPADIEDAVEQVSWNYQDGTVDLGFLSCQPVRMVNPAIDVDAGLKLYPNPNNGQFILDLDLGSSINAGVDVQIMNMLGQVVYSDRTAVMDGKLHEEITLDKTTTAGTYFVRVTSGEQVFTGQIIYQK